MIEWLQYAVVWTFVKALGALQRSAARWQAARGAQLLLSAMPKLRKTAEFNLKLVVCPIYNFIEYPPAFSPWAGWIRV
jgi:hypothetical protein